ncbi:efflux RND transporter periplasmic adaptor subunit [Chitinibacter bivalviorum]|uniref:Efflux RND transporter periplasmic adaptor subunit n=1 Tax=Chitinibacter bivalviorum TaxID=2739434 RepID=A0A7H9BE06_9NEIS|nr:efflux RND transporter periplasmic adaptor subunit [Chitinibacter bivalviorum]QLG86757.1 efflux RND transporter periplasmic adaptor subunit [Chitinibacter bivalviorum]
MKDRSYFLLTIASLLLVLTACEKAPDKNKAKTDRPVSVMSTVLKPGTLAREIRSNGHVESVQMVEIRPQINAQIAGIHFKEGEEVKAGQLLFTLDARNDEAQAKRSQAVIEQMKAQLAEADRSLQRSIELEQAKFVSSSAVDTAKAKAESLRAQLAAAKADQAAANVKLSYNRITAPFAGRTGKINVHTGSLAQTNSAEPLVTLTQLNPVRISFNVSERDLPVLLAAQHNAPLPVIAQLPDGKPREGKLVFLDSAVDKTSGTILAKAEFENADRQLWPGLSTTIQIDLGQENGLVLPLQAIQTGPEQRFVYVIGADNKVQSQAIEVIRIHDGKALVNGLKAGAKVVREGGQNLRPGSLVIEASRPSKAASSKASEAQS